MVWIFFMAFGDLFLKVLLGWNKFNTPLQILKAMKNGKPTISERYLRCHNSTDYSFFCLLDHFRFVIFVFSPSWSLLHGPARDWPSLCLLDKMTELIRINHTCANHNVERATFTSQLQFACPQGFSLPELPLIMSWAVATFFKESYLICDN